MAVGSTKTMFNFAIDKDVDERLERLSARAGVSKARLIREMIDMNIDTMEKIYNLIEGKATISDMVGIMASAMAKSNADIKFIRKTLEQSKYADDDEQLTLEFDQ